MAGCLEDLSPTVTEDSGERLLADNEWGKIKTIHRKSGFRDGVSSSSDLHVQEGFKDGFRAALHHSVNTGYLKGLISPHQSNTEQSDINQLCGQLDKMIDKVKQCPEHMDHSSTSLNATVEDFINMHHNDQITNLYKQFTMLCKSISKPVQST